MSKGKTIEVWKKFAQKILKAISDKDWSPHKVIASKAEISVKEARNLFRENKERFLLQFLSSIEFAELWNWFLTCFEQRSLDDVNSYQDVLRLCFEEAVNYTLEIIRGEYNQLVASAEALYKAMVTSDIPPEALYKTMMLKMKQLHPEASTEDIRKAVNKVLTV